MRAPSLPGAVPGAELREESKLRGQLRGAMALSPTEVLAKVLADEVVSRHERVT